MGKTSEADNNAIIIGQGAFGKVKIIEEKKTKMKYALKYMDKRQIIKENAMYLVFRERMMLAMFRSPFIVGLKYCFQDDENLFLGLEFAKGGDLRFSMNEKVLFDDHTLRVYAAELSLGINYMHSKKIIHRDLKPENILLTGEGHILITDLNLATSLKKRKPSSRSGTLDYMAPEMLINQPYGYAIDWWAMGTILYELVYCKLPFGGGEDKNTIMENIKTKPLVFHKENRYGNPVNPNEQRTDIIKGLLNREVGQRLGSANEGLGFESQIKPHPFFAELDWVEVKQRKVAPIYKPANENDAMNFSPNLLIEELLGGEETLAYRPRKKKKDPNHRSLGEKISSGLSSLFGSKSRENSISDLKEVKKSRKEIELEQMDLCWTDFDWERNDNVKCSMPSSSGKPKSKESLVPQVNIEALKLGKSAGDEDLDEKEFKFLLDSIHNSEEKLANHSDSSISNSNPLSQDSSHKNSSNEICCIESKAISNGSLAVGHPAKRESPLRTEVIESKVDEKVLSTSEKIPPALDTNQKAAS